MSMPPIVYISLMQFNDSMLMMMSVMMIMMMMMMMIMTIMMLNLLLLLLMVVVVVVMMMMMMIMMMMMMTRKVSPTLLLPYVSCVICFILLFENMCMLFLRFVYFLFFQSACETMYFITPRGTYYSMGCVPRGSCGNQPAPNVELCEGDEECQLSSTCCQGHLCNREVEDPNLGTK